MATGINNLSEAVKASMAGRAGLDSGSADGKYTVSTYGSPGDIQNKITRKQFDIFRQEFRPLEERALTKIRNPNFANKLGQRAASEAGDAVDSTKGIARRQLSRFGREQTREEKEVSKTRRGLDRALAVSNARNTATEEGRTMRTSLARDALKIGNDVAGQGASDVSSAAGMEEAREQSNADAKHQRKQNTLNTAMGLAGIAATFI